MGRKKRLTDKEEHFCQEYSLVDNATRAYRLAYNCENMQPNTIYNKAYLLLKKPHIIARIAELTKERGKKYEATAERLKEERSKIATFDIRQLFSEEGVLKPVSDWDHVAGAVVKSVKVKLDKITVERDDKAKKDETIESSVVEVRLNSKDASLTALEKMLGMYAIDNEQKKEKTVVFNNVELPAEMMELIPVKKG